MREWLWCAVLASCCACGTAAQPPARTPKAERGARDNQQQPGHERGAAVPGEYVPNGAELRRVSTALDQLGARIENLAPDATVNELLADLREVARSQCALREADIPHARNGLELSSWWERGGHEAVLNWFTIRHDRVAWLAPDLVPSLASDTDPDHQLAPLLCSMTDQDCGQETHGWEVRADLALADLTRVQAVELQGDEGCPPSVFGCGQQALSESRADRFDSWLDCMADAVPTVPTRPLGHLRAPTTGWLTTVRHGYWHPCVERRAHDLHTGHVWEWSQCWDKDGRPQPNLFRAGTVPVVALREAAWFLLIADEIQDVRRFGEGHELPDGVVLMHQQSSHRYGSVLGVLLVSDALELDYRLTGVIGQEVVSDLKSYHELEPTKRYASRLLRALRASFRDACPRTAPQRSAVRALVAHSGVDDEADTTGQVERGLARLVCRQ